MAESLRTRIYKIVESTHPDDLHGQWFDYFIVALIITNVIAVILETVEGLYVAYTEFFTGFELFSVAVFTVEYLVRLWVVVDSPNENYRHPFNGRLRYAVTPMALIDIAAILPFYLSLLIPVDLRFMRVFRLLRLLKLTRYSTALQTLGAVLYDQRRTLGASIFVMLILLVFSSSIIYLVEKDAQPEAFSSIPKAMWWGLATLTTVGYGDVTPATGIGKVFGATIMVLGIGMAALPAGILATGFATEMQKRTFVVHWKLVAGVPLFTSLDALRISEITQLLELNIVPADYAIVRKGEPADSMFFISRGEVEVDVGTGGARLGPGSFFGEIALLKNCNRTATVISVTECQLLVLSVEDFNNLLRSNPDMRETVNAVMDERLQQLEASDGS
ncbi:MAG: Cyclic nucleotide-gated potassium channel [Alphaproteobacteria bacterium MarineAlpha3_Bin4]|nr:MAG: Cyclic nucleotide-gated potassium channel [Alphaproteobacteria bacterium MarineAlpha3_Bin4]